MRVGRAGTIAGLSLLLTVAPGPGIRAARADAASLDNAVVQWNTALLQAVSQNPVCSDADRTGTRDHTYLHVRCVGCV